MVDEKPEDTSTYKKLATYLNIPWARLRNLIVRETQPPLTENRARVPPSRHLTAAGFGLGPAAVAKANPGNGKGD